MERDAATGVATLTRGTVQDAVVTFLVHVDAAVAAETEVSVPEDTEAG